MQLKKYTNLSHYFIYFVSLHKYKFISLFLTSTLYSISTSLSPYLIKIIVDNVVNFRGNPQDIYAVVLTPAVIYILIRILLSIFMRVENIIQVYTIPKTKAQMREDMFKHVIKHSYIFFQTNISGRIANQILNMANSFERIYTAIHDGIFPCIMSFLISAVIMYKTVPSFAYIFAIWFVLSLVVTSCLSTRSITLSDQRASAENNVSGYVVDTYRNISTVLAFFNKKLEIQRMNQVQDKELKASIVLEWELIKIHAFRSIATTIMLIFMLYLLIEGWKNGWVTIGDFSFVSSTAFNMTHLTWQASREFVTLYKEWGIARQSFSLLEITYSNLDLPNAKPLTVTNGQIEFSHVDFKYPTGNAIFKNQNVVIKKQEKVGLVGFSGSGKTTFIKLILRFFEPQAGQIKIDNQDLSQVQTASIRENIAMIPQDPGLFNRTIYENILYGNPNASYEEVLDAARQTDCEEFILKLPDGFNTLIGEQGEGLSAGQKQRLAFARAAIKNAPILILDEATSALDSVTEQKIQQSIHKLIQNKTAIVIAHRLSTIMHLDRILVFHNGRIVEDGTHQDLLAKAGHYARLWEMQISGFVLDKTK